MNPEEIRRLGTPLVEALERHDPGALAHADATAAWALALGVELGFDRDRALTVREAARLHAVGDVYVPAGLLRRPDVANEAERGATRRAPDAAADLAEGAGLPADVAAWVRAHRERYDGTGFPRGLRGDAIPVESRAIAVACAYDELVADRPARRALDQAGAIAHLRGRAGAEFDPVVVEAMARVAGNPY